jgi:hypothetical protein
MLLTTAEIERCMAALKRAFPRFGEWEFNNERNDSYSGFSVWGNLTAAQDDPSAAQFFVTFGTEGDKWLGYLTVGKPSYYWSSADAGDADLLATEACTSLEEAIAALRRRFSKFAAALLSSDA